MPVTIKTVIKPVFQPFKGSHLKIERARRHIKELDGAIKTFFETYPHRVVVEEDAEPGMAKIVARTKGRIPEPLSLIVGDAIHNLRTALDLLACDLVRLNGRRADKVHFPFPGPGQTLNQAIKDGKVNRAAPDLVNVIRQIEPHLRNRSSLGGLHELDLIDKHRLIISCVGAAEIRHYRSIGPTDLTLTNTSRSPVDDGTIFLRFIPGPDTKMNEELQATFYVLFGDGHPWEDEPIVPTLEQLSNLVEELVGTLETRCIGIPIPQEFT